MAEPILPDNAPKTPKDDNLSYAQWGNIHKDLLAKIYTVDKDGVKNGEYTVVCAVSEGAFEVGSEYSSPFDANPDQRMPTLMGMIQSGDFVRGISAGMNNLKQADGNSVVGDIAAGAVALAANTLEAVARAAGIESLGSAIEKLAGRTNLTKVNSTQIFVSSKPVELSLTLYFRAWKNAKDEVEKPISQLEQWASPAFLSKNGTIENVTKSINEGNGVLGGLFPSTTPPFVALNYAGKTFLPFTIRSVSHPLVVERDSNMNALAQVVTVQLSSRTSWDATDIQKLYGY